MNRVSFTHGYFPEDDRGRPVANGYLYVGEPDTDPTVIINQKDIFVQQESGAIVSVSQPLRTNAGGVPEYDGSPVTLLTNGNYSLAVHDSNASQVYYIPAIFYNDEDVISAVADYTSLRAITGSIDGEQISVSYRTIFGDQGGGLFQWDSTDHSTATGTGYVDADTDSGIFVAPDSDLTGANGAWVRVYAGPVLAPWFGNDRDAWQAALAYGEDVHFPAGVYSFGTEFTLTTNNQTISGDGKGLTLFEASSVIQGFAGSSLSGVVVRNIGLKGGHTVYVGTALTGIRFIDSDDCEVLNCEVSYFERGIKFEDDCSNPVANLNEVHDCFYIGIMADGTDTSASGSIDHSDRVKNPRFINNTVYNIGTSTYSGGGLRTEETYGGIVANNTVYGGPDIRIEDSDQVVVSNNNIKESRTTGLWLYNRAKRCTVVGNNIWDCNTDNNTNGATDLTPNLGNADLAGCGIELQYYCNNNVITGNTCYNSSIGTGYQQFGIGVNLRNFVSTGAGASTGNIITGNNCIGNIVGEVEDRGFNNVIDSNITDIYEEYS